MSHKRCYQVTVGDDVYEVYCDTLPTGWHHALFQERHHKVAPLSHLPHYDPRSPNSVDAWVQYAAVHQTVLGRVWQFLHDNNGTFVWGKELIEYFGTAALERVRDLRKYGWPIEEKSNQGPGAWWYRLNLQPPRRVRYVRRSV